MKNPRFIPTENGLMLETPIPLSRVQRSAAAKWAITEYKRRLRSLTGQKREVLVAVIKDLLAGNFIERPIPAHDYEREALIYGK